MLEIIPLSSLVKVFSDEAPTAKPFSKLSMFKNEKASVQIAVKGDVDCALGVTVRSDLGDDVKLYVVEEIYSGMPVANAQDSYTLRKESGYFPDLLIPCDGEVKLVANKWKSIWIEIAPKDVLPCKETVVSVYLKADGATQSVDFTLDIIDALLPQQSLIYTNWFHTDCLAHYYDVPVFSDRYWEIVENYLKTACDYGMNMCLTPIFTPPLDTKIGKERKTVQLIDVEIKDGNYTFAFDNLSKWIDMCERIGIKYYEMSHLFTQWGAKKCPKIVAKVDGIEKRIFGWNTRGAGKKYRAFLAALAPELKRFLRDKGVFDRVFFHVSDEPMSIAKRSYGKASSIVKELFGEFEIIDALSDYDFYKKGLVKLPIPATDHIAPFIGNVPQLWTYNCGAQFKDVSNRFFSMPSQRNRVLGYQLYKYGVKGFLHWGYNFWFKRLSVGALDPFKESDAGGYFPSGDSYVVYPGKDGMPLKSLRLNVFNDGLQDMRALQLAESLIGREETMRILESGLSKPITFAEYPHSDEWQLEIREAINAAIKAKL